MTGPSTGRRWRCRKRATAPNDLVYDPSDPQRLYLSCWPLTVGAEEVGGGLFRSEDGGVTWRQVFREKTMSTPRRWTRQYPLPS